MYYVSIGSFANTSQVLANSQTQTILQLPQLLRPIKMVQEYRLHQMDHPESLTPPKDLLDKWQQDAYRDYGCADAAYASVIENAAKWGYSQAMKQMYQKLQNLIND